MISMYDVLLTLLGGVLSWCAFNFIGSPIKDFFKNRGEVLRSVANNSGYFWSNVDAELLESASRDMHDKASVLRAWKDTHPIIGWFLKRIGYSVTDAVDGIQGLANSVRGSNFDVRSDYYILFKTKLDISLKIKREFDEEMVSMAKDRLGLSGRS